MKINYLVISIFQWIVFLMKITINCMPMRNASSSSPEIDEDRTKAAAELQYLCDWSPFKMRGRSEDVASECNGKCGQGFAFLHPNMKHLICYTVEKKADVYAYDMRELACECGLVKHHGKSRQKTSCENVPYKIKARKKYSNGNCRNSCRKVTLFVTRYQPKSRLEWCDTDELNAVFNKVLLKGVVKGRFEDDAGKRRRKCWCGIAAGDIRPSYLNMPMVGMEYWLHDGLKPETNVSQRRELTLVTDMTGDYSREKEPTLGENNIPEYSPDVYSSITPDLARQAVHEELNGDSGPRYYDFLNAFSQSCDKVARITNNQDVANENSLINKKGTLNISKEDLQLGIGSSHQEGACNKPKTEIRRMAKQNMNLRIGSGSHKIKRNKTETETPLVSENDLQLSHGWRSRKMTLNISESETRRGSKQDLQLLKAESGNQKFRRYKSETETITMLGKNVDTRIGLGCQKMPCVNSSEEVDANPISKCHDFFSLKLGSQDNTVKNVTSLDSSRKKNYKHEKEEYLSQSDSKKAKALLSSNFQ